MRTFAWITCLFLFGCASTPTKDNSDAGDVSDAGCDGGAGCDAGTACDGAVDGGSASLIYCQSFAGRNGDDWPAPWQPIGGHIPVHDIQDNRGRFRSDAIGSYPLGRMNLPGFNERNVDATWTVSFEDPTHQGSGFYVRQNGQYIGDGYVLFLEGFLGRDYLGLWYAVNGVETEFYEPATPTPSPFNANTPYRMRFEVVQVDSAHTRLRGKVWLAAQAEPSGWQVETTDATPALQNVAGSFAFDVYNTGGSTGNVFVSDLQIRRP